MKKQRNGSYLLQHFSATLAFGGFSACHTIPYPDKLSIDVFHTGSNRVLNGFLDLLLDEGSCEWPEGFVQQVVFRVANGELEGVDLDDDVLDLEDRGFIFVGRNEMYSGLQRIRVSTIS